MTADASSGRSSTELNWPRAAGAALRMAANCFLGGTGGDVVRDDVQVELLATGHQVLRNVASWMLFEVPVSQANPSPWCTREGACSTSVRGRSDSNSLRPTWPGPAGGSDWCRPRPACGLVIDRTQPALVGDFTYKAHLSAALAQRSDS
jgi:hypothetical protein